VHVPSFTRNGSWGLLLGEGLDIDEETVREQVEKLLHGKIQFVKRVEIDYADGNHQALEALRKNSAGVIVAVPADTNPVDAIAGTLNAFREASNSNDNVILLFGKVQRQDLWRRWIREKHLGFDLLGVPE
jgi:DNA-binding Lrp family transcriptional regulator